jgi:hypothetical protein
VVAAKHGGGASASAGSTPQWLGALEARRRTHSHDNDDGDATDFAPSSTAADASNGGSTSASRVAIAADYQSLLAKVAAFAQTLAAE